MTSDVSMKDFTTDLREPFIPKVETDMSRRYLMVMQRWIPVCMEYFQEWPDRPNCGHFFSGVYWYGSETAGPLKVLSLTISSPEYDEDVVGFSKKELVDAAVKALRYLCFTHDTGPEDCVRPAEGLGRPELCRTKWGERGKGFFRESQCGRNVANITTAALILRRYLDDETWTMVANICADYLDRFGDMPPRSGVYANTQMEENAWTSLGLAASYLFLSRHENARRWEENAKRWMFCTATVPQDMFNRKKFDGKLTVSQLCGLRFTALPDFMAENHGFVHPSYTASAIYFTGLVGNMYRIYGRKEPKHVYWHRQDFYDNLKRLCDSTGSPHPVQGMDWPYLTPRCFLHTSAYLYLRDPDAGYYERVALDLLEKIQLGNKGRMVDPEVASRCHDQQDPLILRELGIVSVADAYLAHRLFAEEEKVKPTSPKEIAEKFRGVKVYPHSGFVFHKHGRGQTSFSWRNYIMALPLTREGLLTIGPSAPRHGLPSLLGKVSVRGHPESQKLVSINVKEEGDRFVATLVNDVSQESVRQEVLFASLPDGKVVSLETFTALKECTVEKVEQGYLQITNENFPCIEGNCNGFRRLYYPGGSETFKGFPGRTPDEDIFFTLESPGWLNVDDRVGIIFQGSGRTVYHNRHYFRPPSSPYHAIADDLILSVQDKPKKYHAGEIVAKLTLVLYPEQPHRETERMRFTEVLSGGKALGLMVDDYLCVGNFGEVGRYTFKLRREETVPIFPGITTIKRNGVSYTIHLGAGEGKICEPGAFIETKGENLKVEYTDCGGLYLINEGEETVDVHLRKGKEKMQIKVKAKETVKVIL